MSRDIVCTLASMVEQSLRDHGHQEMDYAVSQALVPGPNGQPSAVLAVTLVLPAVALGESHSATVAIPPAIPSTESVDRMVKHVTEGLMDAKQKAVHDTMRASNGSGQVDPTNLIVPGP